MTLKERQYLRRMLPCHQYQHRDRLTVDDIDCANKEVLRYIKDKMSLKIKEMTCAISNDEYEFISIDKGISYYRIKDWSKHGCSQIDSVFRGVGRIQERTLDYSPLYLKNRL